MLYVGDHIYGDVLRAKKESTWRTAMIIQEMDDELRVLREQALSFERADALEQMRDAVQDELREHQARLKRVERKLSEHESGPERAKWDAKRVRHRRSIDRLRAQLKELNAERAALDDVLTKHFIPSGARSSRPATRSRASATRSSSTPVSTPLARRTSRSTRPCTTSRARDIGCRTRTGSSQARRAGATLAAMASCSNNFCPERSRLSILRAHSQRSVTWRKQPPKNHQEAGDEEVGVQKEAVKKAAKKRQRRRRRARSGGAKEGGQEGGQEGAKKKTVQSEAAALKKKASKTSAK